MVEDRMMIQHNWAEGSGSFNALIDTWSCLADKKFGTASQDRDDTRIIEETSDLRDISSS